MQTDVRKATAKDAAILASVIRRAYRDIADRFGLTPENCPTHPSNCEQRWIESDLARGVTYFLLYADGTPCGCVAVEHASREVSYLERLAVIPEKRNAGFGRRLVDRVLQEARASGAGAVSIGIIAKQVELGDWYRRLGFIDVDRRSFDHLPFEVAFLRYEL